MYIVYVCVWGGYSRLWKIKTGKQDENIFSVEKKKALWLVTQRLLCKQYIELDKWSLIDWGDFKCDSKGKPFLFT